MTLLANLLLSIATEFLQPLSWFAFERFDDVTLNREESQNLNQLADRTLGAGVPLKHRLISQFRDISGGEVTPAHSAGAFVIDDSECRNNSSLPLKCRKRAVVKLAAPLFSD